MGAGEKKCFSFRGQCSSSSIVEWSHWFNRASIHERSAVVVDDDDDDALLLLLLVSLLTLVFTLVFTLSLLDVIRGIR